ncbi:AAA family ATPase [Alcanivorax sp. 1008]|uniref:AAA family ATPase n=1 Tax=Alcanivorax sp. 1008 TaxID=2816853 RepID=UPI001D49346E|nr:AAA family ATPase [Alcanivorax sp. 1008]MCC1497937.1 AAA family ATPase [Alcanivorax sp. 1008]
MSNFDFIKARQPDLAELGQWAEKYAYSDPQSAITKLRCFGEIYVGFIYEDYSLPSYGAKTFFERLDNAAFKNAIEASVVEKLHAIRMKGNKAAHPAGVSVDDALWLIKEAYFLSAWLYVACHGGKVEDLPEYHEPQPHTPEEKALRQDKAKLEQALSLQTEDLEKSKAELQEAQERISQALNEIEQLNNAVDQARLAQLAGNSLDLMCKFDMEQDETRKRVSMHDVFSDYQLTNDQEELVEELNIFLDGKEDNVFLLKGYAGTGKTFITKGLTEYFRSIGRNYILAAPTGKASKVISSKTKSPAYTIHKTIYSFKDIGDYRENDLEGTQTYKFYSKLAVNEHSVDTVYIIDEASMVSDIYNEAEFFRFGSGFLLRDLLEFINLDHNDHNKKLIFIGDNAQLPPVGMNTSPALDTPYLLEKYNIRPKEFELTEVVRQKADSGVMLNATMIRDAIEKRIFNRLDIDISPEDVEHVEYSDLLERYLDSCDRKINAESIVIAHSNADVAEYNKRIREFFFPGNEEVVAGDKIMAVSNSDAHGFFISNGDFGQVRKIYKESEERAVTLKKRSAETGEVEKVSVNLKFRDALVGFRDFDGEPRFFDVKIIENLLYSSQPNLTSDENKALYVDFCMRHPRLNPKSTEFKDTLRSDPYFNALRVKFGYAITCHKAQGSEWSNVFVKCRTHQNQLSAEYFRWIYTAITRTSDNLFLMDEPHLQPESNIDWGEGESAPWEVSSEIADLPPHSNSLSEDQPVETGGGVARENKFGIPSNSALLLAILDNINTLVSSTKFSIESIDHNQYQEAYTFRCGDELVRINISYSTKKNQVTAVNAQNVDESSSEIQGLLETLVNTPMVISSKQSQSGGFLFSEDFLNVFHDKVLHIAEENNVHVSGAEEKQWFQRYTFARDSEMAVLDIYYDGKKRFTKCIAQKSLSNSQEFIAFLTLMLQKGLG